MAPENYIHEPSNPRLHALQQALVDKIAARTSGDEDCATSIPNLLFFRRESVTDPCACLIEPCIVLVVQGAKQMLVGDAAYPYDVRRFLVNSVDLPASSQVIDASAEKPCLGLVFKIDLSIVAELISLRSISAPQAEPTRSSLIMGTVTTDLLEPFNRLLELLNEPHAIPVLAPLVQREIHYRLLMSDQSARIWQIASTGSQSQRIAKAIDWLKKNYNAPLRVEDLAIQVQMSTSSFHHHFRTLTAMSPLQYQKWLRLNEARRLMLNGQRDAATAAFQVGYESPSQFSREYSRLFGAPPKRDIESLLRGHTQA